MQRSAKNFDFNLRKDHQKIPMSVATMGGQTKRAYLTRCPEKLRKKIQVASKGLKENAKLHICLALYCLALHIRNAVQNFDFNLRWDHQKDFQEFDKRKEPIDLMLCPEKLLKRIQAVKS